MAQVIVNIFLILLLVFSNGFFVAAEFAIVKVRSTQIELKIQKGHRRALLAKHIVEHLNKYLPATQLGITLSTLGLGWVGEPLLAEVLRGFLAMFGILDEQSIHVVAFIISFGFLTFIQITFGELGPRYLAIHSPETTSLMVSFPLQLFYRVFNPFIWILTITSNYFLRQLGISTEKTSELVHSPEELELIVTEGAKSGGLNRTEQELISSIFEFSNTTAKEIMLPRTDTIAVELNTPREKLIQIVTEEGYSRLPVYKETIDNIVGIIYTKDLISLLEHRDLIVMQDIIRPPFFVPDSIKISQLMRDLQEQKIHMAIVVDEFGGTEGIITMEDILEEIVGEIHDEYDEVLKDIETSTDGSAFVNARISIADFNEKFGSLIPENPGYETLNGFLSKITGRIPDLHEEIEHDKLHFTIMKKSQRRIRQVKVKKIPASAQFNL